MAFTLEELAALETELRKTWHKHPREDRPFMTNLIEQIKNYRKSDNLEQRKSLEAQMARQLKMWRDRRGKES
jgi:hypothetical protein